MLIGNIGKLTFLNGDLHFEIDTKIAGTPAAPVSADVQVGELLALLQANVTNPLEKAALGMVIGLLGTINLQTPEKAEEAMAPWLLELLQLLPGILQAIIGALKASPAASAKLQSELLALK